MSHELRVGYSRSCIGVAIIARVTDSIQDIQDHVFQTSFKCSRTVYRILENLSMSRKLMSHELRIRAHTYFIIAYCVATAQVLLGV